MPEAVFLLDTDSRIRELNSAAEQFAGRAAAELRGTHIQVLGQALGLEPGNGETDASLGVSRALRGEVVRQQRGVFRRFDGKTPLHAIISASPIRDLKAGETIGALLIVRDVTELTELRHVVTDAERHLAAGQMAAVMAHDFSNVLNSITQAATLLDMKEAASSSERQPYVKMIRNAANRGIEIIQRLRESIIGSKGETSEVTGDDLLEEAVELARPLWTRVNGLSVERRYDAGKVPLCVNAADVRRALVNLIINAIQAMPNGGKLTLSTSIKEHGALLGVEDTGHGIPDEVRPQIFSPYFTTKQGGTGLGLSGARRIITAQGGRIFFVSHAGAGTKFCVELPIANHQKRKKSA